VTYVYASESYWDKDKKQPRNKRVCIGKIDPQTNKFVQAKRLNHNPTVVAMLDSAVTASAEVVGPSIILNSITQEFGIDKLLTKCFPNYADQILTMAYYLAIDGRALSHCEQWCQSHAPSMAKSLTSQNISQILNAMTFDARQTFLLKWMHQIAGNGYFCYDITSISSYAESNEYIKYGYNRDNESLPQLNLAVLFSQETKLPAYFHRMPGSITDVTTIHNLLKTFKLMEIGKISYVLDKGFYSKQNIDDLLKTKNKFLVSVPLKNKWLQNAIDDVHDDIHGPIGYRKIDDEVLYVHTRPYLWGNGDKKHRCYLHLYYNAGARASSVDKFNEELYIYKQELESGQRNRKHQWAYDEFFIIKMTSKDRQKIEFNMSAVSQYIKRYAGFYALLSNSTKDPMQALQIYRDKDAVEKCFDDYKSRLDMKRLRMHSSTTVDSRLFIQFIALIYLSALRQKMRQADMMKQYTVRELLNETETLVKVKYSGKYGHILTEITKAQGKIFDALKINPHSPA